MYYVKYKFLVTQMNFIHLQAFSENPNLDFRTLGLPYQC